MQLLLITTATSRQGLGKWMSECVNVVTHTVRLQYSQILVEVRQSILSPFLTSFPQLPWKKCNEIKENMWRRILKDLRRTQSWERGQFWGPSLPQTHLDWHPPKTNPDPIDVLVLKAQSRNRSTVSVCFETLTRRRAEWASVNRPPACPPWPP